MKKKTGLLLAVLMLILSISLLSSFAYGETKDVWIDNTVDTSVTNVIAKVIKVTPGEGDSSSTESEETIYNQKFNVTFSDPKPDAVTEAVNEAYQLAESEAKKLGSDVEMNTAEATGKVWDNRKYETIEDSDAVLIGDTDYFGNSTIGGNSTMFVSDSNTRTHIASGDYGKETFITITAKVTITPHVHSLTKTDKKDSTCKEEGTEAYWTCSGCGLLFSDEEGKTQIEKPVVIEKKAHTEVKDAAVAATCTKDGLTEGSHCSVCNEVIKKQEVVPAGHTEVIDPAVPATCTEDGLTEGSQSLLRL